MDIRRRRRSRYRSASVEFEVATAEPAQQEIALGGSQYPPIADYGFLSDCEVCALVAKSGNVEWMCLPRMDGPSVFAGILDRHAGRFRVGPRDEVVPADRRYLPGTMILETTWGTPTGWLVVRDVLLIGPWHHGEERSRRYARSPRDHEAAHVLLRTMRCLNGFVDVELDCEPAFDYARRRGSWSYAGDGYGDGICTAEGTNLQLRLRTDMRLGFEGPRARAETRMRAGDTLFCALGWSTHLPPESYEEAHDKLSYTGNFWHEWISRGRFPDHPWRVHLQRSALTLKGLTYAPTGAMMAAATTSLPETPGGERNWDYRYTWLRDSTFMLWGLSTLGFDREAHDFLYFITDRLEAGGRLSIMYGIDGRERLEEEILDHLDGYEGAKPVRIGNGAWDQRQHDVWGVLLDSIRLHIRSGDRLDDRLWPLVVKQVDTAVAEWHEPDRGIWEVRGEPQHFTSSKIFCWVAADRGARLARLRGDREAAKRWRAAADEMHAEICERGVDERGVFVQHYDTDALDASLLLIPMLGFLPSSDPRVRNTVLAIADELTVNDLVLRYRVEETDDGLTGEEGSFAICSFWLVSALVEIGEVQRARDLCDKLLSYASPLALYAEEIDPHSGRHLGNFPQAFTHLALINAVMHIIRADEALVDDLR
ncbi:MULTISPECIES: glycoside hydrolase family 15 protein [unclassified Conexibacter]|uniref:glycoside hydrolase family 15 protein n=1 Tax=unclassified Conexibacter TaxID=2627773 RepID=UPI00351C6371